MGRDRFAARTNAWIASATSCAPWRSHSAVDQRPLTIQRTCSRHPARHLPTRPAGENGRGRGRRRADEDPWAFPGRTLRPSLSLAGSGPAGAYPPPPAGSAVTPRRDPDRTLPPRRRGCQDSSPRGRGRRGRSRSPPSAAREPQLLPQREQRPGARLSGCRRRDLHVLSIRGGASLAPRPCPTRDAALPAPGLGWRRAVPGVVRLQFAWAATPRRSWCDRRVRGRISLGCARGHRHASRGLRADVRAVHERADRFDDRLRTVEVALGRVDQRLLTIERVVLPAPALPTERLR